MRRWRLLDERPRQRRDDGGRKQRWTWCRGDADADGLPNDGIQEAIASLDSVLDAIRTIRALHY
jgi:hypothetical protein